MVTTEFYCFPSFGRADLSGTEATVFTFQNKCRITVWPAVQPNAGKPMMGDGGFRLRPNETAAIAAPDKWAGRFWARSGCQFDASGFGNCTTGDCGGALRCNGIGGQPPLSLAEFNLADPVDFYDVSFVDGYNMKVGVIPQGGTGGCQAVKCVWELLRRCPQELQVVKNGRVVACKSACQAFDKPEYCCTDVYTDPKLCKPSVYSRVFKSACPRAYSYAYDDATSIYTCQKADYLITFCA